MKKSLIIVGVILFVTLLSFQGCKKSSAHIGLEIIIDNLDGGFSVLFGSWGTCGCTNCGGTCYGTNFRYAAPKSVGDTTIYARAQFTPNFIEEGNYDVYIWWPKGGDRATTAPVIINHANGSNTFTVDLRNNGSSWYKLGTFQFFKGSNGSVIVEDSDTGYVNADAVRFVGVE